MTPTQGRGGGVYLHRETDTSNGAQNYYARIKVLTEKGKERQSKLSILAARSQLAVYGDDHSDGMFVECEAKTCGGKKRLSWQ